MIWLDEYQALILLSSCGESTQVWDTIICRSRVINWKLSDDGRGFQPDFVLFLREKNGASLSYQLFIESKGEHLAANDRWKEDFLKEICAEYRSKILTENSKYRIIGVPSFYHERYENQFKDELNAALIETAQTSEQDELMHSP